MVDASILASVKKALGITGTYQDDALSVHIEEVIAYMVGAGVPSSLANNTASTGVIARGVTDLLYNGGNFSSYFYQRVSQMTYNVSPEDYEDAEISQETIDEALGVAHDEMG